MTVTTALGCLRLAIAPEQWPAMASAATLPEGKHRRAVASLLFREQLIAAADRVLSVDLQILASSALVDTGVSVRCQGTLLHLVHVDEALLETLESQCSFTAQPPPAVLLGMRIPTRVLLGARFMAQRVVRAVRYGDVVLLPVPAPSTDASPTSYPATCVWGDGNAARESRLIEARVLLQNGTMTFLEKPTRKSESSSGSMPVPVPTPEASAPGEPGATSMSQPPAETSSDPASTFPNFPEACDLECLELLVHFELAGPLLRLTDIANLDVDDVLDLAVPVDQARVRITVARQMVGVGELVVVAGRLGVRVLHMKLGDGPKGAA